MALRLIRQESDTPSVRNTDDARMARYAYGGYNGIVKGHGTELSASAEGSALKIGSGCAVVDGWEVEVDANGWLFTVDNVSTLRYYSVYLEINLATQTTRIVPVYDTSDYPAVEKGDDLTNQNTGTARLLLYRFTAQSGAIGSVVAQFSTIEHVKDQIASIEERLSRLGFDEASVTDGGISLNADWTDAVPSYSLGAIIDTLDAQIYIAKSGKFAVLEKLSLATHTKATGAGSTDVNISGTVAVLPEIYRPLYGVSMVGKAIYMRTDSLFVRMSSSMLVTVSINTEGEISVSGSTTSDTAVIISNTYPVVVYLNNCGWKIK